MEAPELRLELLDRIAVIEDTSLLKKLLQFMDSGEDSHTEVGGTPARAYQVALNQGAEDADAGRLVGFEEVMEIWKRRFAGEQ